jgi:hypothetical protein
MDYANWGIKFGAALCLGAKAVSLEDFKRTIPTPQQIAAFNLIEMTVTLQFQTSTLLLAALACEDYGLDEEAQRFIAAIFDPVGGDPKPTSIILAYCVRGRILARRNELKAAAEAFEEAAKQAESYQLWLLVALAYLDLKLHVLDTIGHGDHGSRRLGAVLRRLTGPVSKLTPLLQGLDAAEMITLPPPDASYRVEYPRQESTGAGLRREYEGLRLKELRKRAKDAGMTGDAIEQAMDSDNPEEELITFLIQQQAANAASAPNTL